MGKVGLKPSRYACFTEKQQEFYEKLPLRQRIYVDYRGMGYNKAQSYRMAGYAGKTAGQASYMLEARNSAIREIIEILLSNKKAKEITKEDSAVNKTIDALAQQQGVENMLEKIDGADGETARRIQFYRDIMNGKTKSVRKTKKYNANGALLETRVEEINDIETRIKARRELDRILGLNAVIDIEKLQMGDITINIVDASKKEELQDERNNVVIDIDKVETIDGEKVVVMEEENEIEKPKTKSETFFETVGD